MKFEVLLGKYNDIIMIFFIIAYIDDNDAILRALVKRHQAKDELLLLMFVCMRGVEKR